QEVLVVADHGLERILLLRLPGQEVIEEIGAQAGSGEDSDQRLARRRPVARILHRLPGAFEEDALLRVDERRLAWGLAEEARVEAPDLCQDGARLDEVRIAQRSRAHPEALQLLIRKLADRLDAVA